jgi:peptidyl-prolyl cis-trans isomerase C
MTTSIIASHPTLPRRAGLLAASLALLLVSAAPLAAQDKDPLLAKVNGVEIHQSDLAIAEEQAGQIPPMSADAKRDYLVQFMADLILVSKDAEAKKMGDNADFKHRMEIERRKMLMSELLQQVAKQALTDAAMHKVYDEAVKGLGQQQEVHARHILIRARLNKGEDFAKVASEVTEDPSGKANGGDLGYFTKEQMVPEFANVAFALDKGKISGPVKTQFGWHVIKVEDKRMKTPPKFEEVKGQIEQFVARKAQADLVTKLRAEAKVEKFYKTEAPKTAAPAEKDAPAKK